MHRFGCVLSLLGSLLAPAALRAQSWDPFDETRIQTYELVFAQPNWWTLLAQNFASKTYIKATLKVGSKTFKDVGVRFRGNSSYKAIGASQKKPFKIKLDAFVKNQHYRGHATLNLNNGFRDPTLTREIVSYSIYRRFMPAPRANYVKLVLNGQSWGPYIQVEQINEEMLARWFGDGDGSRYRAERKFGSGVNDSALTWLGTSQARYKLAYELKNEKARNPWTDLIALCNVLNNTPATGLVAQLPKILDVDEALWYLAGISCLPAVDSYIGNVAHNYYLYADPLHGRFALLPWDLNASFGGNAWLSVAQKQTLDPFYMSTSLGRPLLRRVLAVPEWRERYLAHMKTMLETAYDWRRIGAQVAALQKLVEPALKVDSKKLYSMSDFTRNVTTDLLIRITGFRYNWIPGLKPMVERRRAFLLALADFKRPAPGLSTLARVPATPTSAQAVTVTVSVSTSLVPVASVLLFYRTRGAYSRLAMFDDGKHGDSKAADGVWGAAIPAQPAGTRVEYYVRARAPADKGAAMRFAPRLAGRAPASYAIAWPRRASAVRINEFVALNTAGIRDEKGQLEDWVELYNDSTKAVDVSGRYLTDTLLSPTKWKIPTGRSIPAKGTLLVWCDNDPLDGPLHASFNLAFRGEEIALFDTDGATLLDRVAYGLQAPDVATGRVRDGASPFVTLAKPTPRAANLPAPCGQRSYGPLDPGTAELVLVLAGQPKVAAPVALGAGGAPAMRYILVVVALAPGRATFPRGASFLLGDPLLAAILLPSDARGAASLAFTIPDDAKLVGRLVYGQALSIDARAALMGSNGLELRFCPK